MRRGLLSLELLGRLKPSLNAQLRPGSPQQLLPGVIWRHKEISSILRQHLTLSLSVHQIALTVPKAYFLRSLLWTEQINHSIEPANVMPAGGLFPLAATTSACIVSCDL